MLLNYGKGIIEEEAKALLNLSKTLGLDFKNAVEKLSKCKGNIIFSGVGKSGYIARKISSTMTSTGSPSFFIHPTEASHGDIGGIRRRDILVIISNSGNSKELIDLSKFSSKIGCEIILITSGKKSMLSNFASIILLLPQIKEAGTHNIAPTTSTTMALSLGDAVSLALSKYKKFSKLEFSKYHPGGNIGSGLTVIEDIMHTGLKMPLVRETDIMNKVIIEITKKSFGCAGIVNKSNKLIGIITDGDLRRNMDPLLLNKKAKDVMSLNPKTILKDSFTNEVLIILSKHKITSLFVVKNKKMCNPIGIVHLHDCLRSN